ncbi:MAG: hypothetical protein D8M57_06445 [Candidatus Scalindua sp. AMX11]|nr:MAG: hypothetical protein DWQ00_13950 [Candidatus Scalindua sp.]NOG85396.1 hypothetical protein [Planctomycetota bacterium]RZV83993.1 MAG: hypothetical protein EX341_08645 [Candidatus Scalindua sp. SCAELEC01]TDE65722.1 MAG: hypothetical protein D8M57_06445 [Candidatus Scalindua sp. AMX11]GJQ58784.1 MAG: hypothetical protein SCALA701_15850 [Candidatus Scalindua sp.]
MKYSISEASRIVGVTRKTLYKHIQKKPISVDKDENDRPIIDASELVRVYGDKCRFDSEEVNKETGKGTQTSTEVLKPDVIEIAVTQKELEMLRAQMSSERDTFEEQIDYLRTKLDEANSETKKLTALITDQTTKDNGAGEWEKSFKALEARLAKQEKVEKERKEREEKISRENKALRKALQEKKNALQEERSRGLFKKLFS